ncbi:MAG: hypothetical protein AB8I08_12695 [Sandaracinaceae bacterium]
MSRLFRIVLAVALLGYAGCLGSTGPDLPENVGATHRHERSAGAEREELPPAEPVPVGTSVWADFHHTGFHFHGVVVARRGDAGEEEHHVVYDDGATEWVGAEALLPDRLVEDADVDVRRSFTGAFNTARLARNLGRAFYVRLATGDEAWTTLPHLRFQATAENAPSRGDAPSTTGTSGAVGDVGASVLVNYQRQNLRFAAVVTARREDGQLHVVYLDGESEWVEPQVVGPDDLAEGSVVHIRRQWDPPQWVRGRVQTRIGDAFRVELDDGGIAWTSLFRLRAPMAQTDAPPPEVGEEPTETDDALPSE